MKILRHFIPLLGIIALTSALLLADEDKKTGNNEEKTKPKTNKRKNINKKPIIIQKKIKVNVRGNAGGITITTEPDAIKKSTGRTQTAFKLPEKLPNGAVPKFHNADEKVRIGYSEGTRLIVYFYPDMDALQSDYSAFKEVQEKISEADSKALVKHGGVIEKTDKTSTIYFVFEGTVVSFEFKAGTDGKTLVSAAETLLTDEAKRRAIIFGTPEVTFAAARKAIEEFDYATLRIAFPDEVSETAESHLSQLKAEYDRIRKQRSVPYYRPNVELKDSMEDKTDNEAIIEIKATDNKPRIRNIFLNIKWLRGIFGTRPYAGIEIKGLRCFLFKQDGRWFIDIDRNLTEDAELRVDSEKEEPTMAQKTVTKALRIIHDEFQSRFYNDDLDNDGKKDYAQSIEELIETAGDKKSGLQALLKLVTGYIIKIVAKDGEANWYALATPKPGAKVFATGRRRYSSLEKARHFYIDETGIVRFEIGKPANSKSKRYEK